MLQRSRFSRIWLVFIALLGVAHAQVAPQTQARPRRFLMWKAASPTTTVYLVGSIHVGDKSLYPLPPEVESAFAAAKVLAVEINIKNLDQTKTMGLIGQFGMYGANDNLANHISKETSAALDDFCTKHGVPRTGMNQLKPWVVAVSLAAMAWQQAGEDPALGIDMHFLDENKGPQRIDEFETMDTQLSIFADASEEEQQGLLASILKQGDRTKDMIKHIQAAYIAGDPDALQRIMDEETDMGTKSLTKKLLDDRNVNMAARIDTYLKGKDPIFVVVGAAHIIGEKGIANLLRAKGYKVDQVTLEAK